MELIVLTIGHNVAGVPAHSTEGVCSAVAKTLKVDGFTAFQCLGMWRGEAEQSTRVEIACSADEAKRIRANVPELAYMLMQEAIMFTSRTGVEFIEPTKINQLA